MLWAIFSIAAPVTMGLYCIVVAAKNIAKLFGK